MFLMPFTGQAQKNYSQELSKNMSILSSIMQNLNMYYVDSIRVDTLFNVAIDNMLESLDRYTTYYPEEKMDELKQMTTGKYAGIGALISYRSKEKRVEIREPSEGNPAALAGLRMGDIIQSIDGKDVQGMTSDVVSKMLRGEPNTTFTLVVKRIDEKQPLTFRITRRNIQEPTITYYGLQEGGIGYLQLANFHDDASQEVHKALVDMMDKGMKGLVLDLRDNGGGSLQEAVEIVGMFVPKGTEVVSKRGKLESVNESFRTKKAPLTEDMPIVVLVDDNTASASEITSGALQDLDRAVVMGIRTFGKGLVQQLRELPYNGGFKLTTSKYYIPSGRCIHNADSKHLRSDGTPSPLADSLATVFHTTTGREVRDGGGISPDIEMKNDTLATFPYYLAVSDDFVDFCARYLQQHKTVASPSEFDLSDEDYEALRNFIKERNFTYNQRSKELLAQLREIARIEGYSIGEDLDSLQEKLSPELDRDFDRYKEEVKKLINLELISAYYFQRGKVEMLLRYDKQYKAAVELLNDPERYKKILNK
jgi:carboxyl-terminal processing protease